MQNAIDVIFQLAVLLFSVVIHEVSHGYAALLLGDRTAKDAGRLTLNPLPHLDFVGSLIVPLLSGGRFGWARPVPYNPYNLRNQKWGPALVGFAGPAANILLAVGFGLLVRFLPHVGGIIPGSFLFNFFSMASLITFVNLMLAVFNLVPIPPLDGSKLLFAFLPHQQRRIHFFLEHYGIILLVAFIFFFSGWLFPVVTFLFKMITGGFHVF